MKKFMALAMAVCLVLGFTACSGNSDKLEILDWTPSEIYTDEEIVAAIDTVCTDFRHWKGCTLETITYAGDEVSQAYIDWAARYDCDETLVLVSSFSTNSSPEEPLEKNETYDNYKWILVRRDGGDWSHVDHGY